MIIEYFTNLILTNLNTLITLSAVLISWLAYRTQKKTLSIVYYEKKFKVFVDSQKLYQEYTHGEITKDTFSQFISSMYASRILFPKSSGVYELLNSVHASAISFNGCNSQIKKVTDTTTLELLHKELNKSRSHLSGFLDELSKRINSNIEVY